MQSRIIWGVLIVAAAALLVAGAVNRTMARSEVSSSERAGAGQALGLGQAAKAAAVEAGESVESTGAGAGQAQGLGRGQGQGSGRGSAAETEAHSERDGTLRQQGQGQGQGGGRGQAGGLSAAETDAHSERDGTLRQQGQGQGQGGGRGQGGGLNEITEPLAAIEDLDTRDGTVVELNDEMMVLELDNGERFEIGGRAWRYALENGFIVRNQEHIRVVGFYDEDHFEPLSLHNQATDQQIQVREMTGRPMWAGQGWRNEGL